MWPAGHVCPTYKESFQVCWDNSISLFLHCTQYHLYTGKCILTGSTEQRYFKVRWQHGEKVGYCYPSGLEKTLCKWDIYVPLVTKRLRSCQPTQWYAFKIRLFRNYWMSYHSVICILLHSGLGAVYWLVKLCHTAVPHLTCNWNTSKDMNWCQMNYYFHQFHSFVSEPLCLGKCAEALSFFPVFCEFAVGALSVSQHVWSFRICTVCLSTAKV